MSNMLHNNRKNLDLVDYIITKYNSYTEIVRFFFIKMTRGKHKKKYSFLQKSFLNETLL